MRLYSSKIKKLFFFDSYSLGKETANRNNSRIPVIVVDLQTNKSVKYASINQAARFLAAHPKTIWRKVKNKQPYLERYLITEKYDYFSYIYIKVIEYFHVKHLFNNYTMVFYILLLFILYGYTFYKCIPYIILLFTDVYNNDVNHIDKIKVENIKFGLEQKFPLQMGTFNFLKAPFINDKVDGLAEFNHDWRSEYLIKNKSSFIIGIRNKLSVYQSIINELNLDFHSVNSVNNSHVMQNSSPIIERINLNNVFSNAIASTRPSINIVDSINTSNSLVINTQSIHSNRNYSIIDNTLIWPRSPGRELLNYNSNVLYCLINGLSPSTY